MLAFGAKRSCIIESFGWEQNEFTAVLHSFPTAADKAGTNEPPISLTEALATVVLQIVFPDAPKAGPAIPDPQQGNAETMRRPPKSFATAAKSGRQPSHLLHIHFRQENREFILEELFDRLMAEVEERVIKDQCKGAPKLRCSFTCWAGGKGLLGCQDEITAKYLSHIISNIKVGDGTFKAWPRGEHRKLDRLTFYTPEKLAKLQAGQSVIDQMVFWNDLPGEYILYSFQKVGSVDCTGANRKGWYYHVGITKEMREVIVKKDCRLFIILREISVSLSLAGKRPAEHTNRESSTAPSAKASKAKRRKEAQKAKKAGKSLPANTTSAGESTKALSGTLKGDAFSSRQTRATTAAKAAAAAEGTPVPMATGKEQEDGQTKVTACSAAVAAGGTVPAGPEAPVVGAAEKANQGVHLPGAEYCRLQLLEKQVENLRCKLGVNTGGQSKRGPGRPCGSRSKSKGGGAR